MDKIRALFIFEILGKPPEHITNSLEKMIDELAKQKGLEIVRREIHEPKIIDNKDDKKEDNENSLYSTFAEVEVVASDLKLIMAIVLNMLPSHVEILEPTDFVIKNFDLSGLMTELTLKMHKYDEIAKVLILERNELLRRLNENHKMVRESGDER